ncbi:tryptophan synthase subunit alpha [Edwardsiella tarda]|uniref:tryptophan synthase subunit alpha n=1 Tax=Edwardsiella tarda TaxID=636 RepID=UPI0002E077FA|nr:tryptophan synthase subunit alpha [Edwardsiella tarda]
MTRYQTLFSHLHQHQAGAFVPFVTLGDPTPELSLRIIDTLVQAGADALELGIPFSDPLADGPVIQNATLRALQAGVTPERCFALLHTLRAKYPQLPIGLLMYANLVVNPGIDTFYRRCAEAGVDSVLIADVPLEESAPFHAAALRHGVAPIYICPPNADEALLQRLANHSQGYIYLLSRAGVTGAVNADLPPLRHLTQRLRELGGAPALQGFGIRAPEQVRTALDEGAAGAISGSAVVSLIAEHLDDPDQMLRQLHDFVQTMRAAARP